MAKRNQIEPVYKLDVPVHYEPKPTKYKGYSFRSKLEATWAYFFDQSGIKYVYEPDAFIVDKDKQYTPDFYLPEALLRGKYQGVYIEIKPEGYMRDDLYNKMISKAMKELPLILLVGDPMFSFDNTIRAPFIENSNEQISPFWDNNMVFMYCDNCHTYKFEFDEGSYYVCQKCKSPLSYVSEFINKCAEKARGHRFEFTKLSVI